MLEEHNTMFRSAHGSENCYVNKRGERECVGLLGGTVVKNPPADAADRGSTPGPGESHRPRSS